VAADSPRHVTSRDGTTIALFREGSGPPVLLVHGTAGDHTTFRVLGPMLAQTRTVWSMDRRGRGASGDTLPYSIEREFEDVAVVATAIAAATGDGGDAGGAIPVFGHSYGGRCALGAALRTEAISRVICYEGAPAPPGATYHPTGIEARLAADLDAGDGDALLATFMREIVGMSDADLDAYRANPVWPARVAAAGTIPRELAAEASDVASLEALGAVRQPVLQVLGSASLPVFREATVALDARLVDGRVVEIAGAKHAAHHTHPEAVLDAVQSFVA
jgi:pimeloyl-ACP methyl ester carboxylesterase